MGKILYKITNTLTTVLFCVVLVFAVLFVGARFVGFEIMTVLSGSMEPAIPTGSVIYIRSVDPATLAEGDVITYSQNGEFVVTHRIVRVESEGGSLQFYTKGDANNVADTMPVSAENVIGTPWFHIPGMGYLMVYLQSPAGRYAAIAVIAALALLCLLPEILLKGFAEDREQPAQLPETAEADPAQQAESREQAESETRTE